MRSSFRRSPPLDWFLARGRVDVPCLKRLQQDQSSADAACASSLGFGEGADEAAGPLFDLAYSLLKGAIVMTYPSSSASGFPVGKRARKGSAAEPQAKSGPAAKGRTGRAPEAQAVAPAGRSKAAARPAAKNTASALAKRKPAASASPEGAQAPLSYMTIYRATPLERIDIIRRGVPASEAKRLFAELPIGQGAGFKALNLSTATVNKKAKQGDTLSPEESERVVGFAKLVGQLEAMVQESGDPTNFDARAWMARWLIEPLPAFGGARPADLVDTMEGQSLVSAALAKVQSGAYV